MNLINPVTVAIVDDHTLFRQGLSKLLAESKDLEIVFDAENGTEMIAKLQKNEAPMVMLVDINMPVMDGYQTTRWLQDNYPATKVLALSMFEDDKSIIGMLKSGAGGYMLKESKASELINAIITIDKHGLYLNEMVSGKLLRSIQNNQVKNPADNFSNNERKFLELCCTELTYKEIADQMNLSPHTIDNYRENIFQQYGLKSRTGLVLFAIRNELVKI
ncbi:MAG: LuxR family two component transcriptional regulator [Mucilaginibacter sp.]|nr:LuxR family two component transcriptional regulator [Mucilaginibacter sp.]